MKKSIVLFLIFCCCINQLYSSEIEKDTLVVAIKDTPPFIIDGENGLTGLSVDLWEEVADELGFNYAYKKYDLKGLLEALKNEEVDISINPLSVTSERMKDFNFTQPFYISNLCVVVGEGGGNELLGFVKNFFSIGFLRIIMLLLVVILIFGILFWLAERKHQDADFRKGVKGVFDGLWFSAVTMTTVGYGDKSPKTTFGKSIAIIWMFTAIIIISGFTAGIASALTVNELESNIDKISDLQKLKVGTLSRSSSAEYLIENNIDYIGFDRVEDGLKKLEEGKIDAFVYDEPIVQYYIRKDEMDIEILPLKFNAQYYSFALPYSNNLIIKVNPVLLEYIESNDWRFLKSEFGLK